MTIGGIQKFSTVDYPGYTVASIFTIGCNMRCGYCHNPELVLPEQYAGTIPEEEIFEFLEKRRGLARPIDIDAIRESIDLIRMIPHEFRTTIVRGQLVPEDFESIGQLVHGADRFALQYFVPGTTVSPQFNKRESFTKQEMDQARDIMSRHVQECVVH